MFSPQRKPIFAGVGSALGLGDLDNDGDIDIVLANLDAPSSILWNGVGLTFTRQELAADNARAVNVVDFDGDGWQDLILSHPGNPPSLWLSAAADGTRTFSRTEGFGPWHVLNAIALADVDRDGDLDLAGRATTARSPSSTTASCSAAASPTTRTSTASCALPSWCATRMPWRCC